MRTRRILSLVLAMAMVLGLVTVPAFAESENVLNVSNAEELNAAFAEASTSKDAVVIKLTSDIELSNWTPIMVNNSWSQNITLDGNNKQITKLNKMLFDEIVQVENFTVKDLTISGANITDDGRETTHSGKPAVAAIVGTLAYCSEVNFVNCNVINSQITGTEYAGGLIGWNTGFTATNDIDVDSLMTVNIENCSVSGNTISAVGSVGGLIGHAGQQEHTLNIIKDTVVEKNTITCTENRSSKDSLKSGAVIGTINCGDVVLDVSEKSNTVNATLNNANYDVTTVYGRTAFNGVGSLKVNGGDYDAHPTNESTDALCTIEGTIIQEADDRWYFPVAKIGETYYTSLQKAIEAAGVNAVITLVDDVNINAVDGQPATHAWVQADDNVIIDLNNKTVDGAFFIDGTATIKNGNIVNTDCVSCIETVGNLTLENVNATSDRHALRVAGGTVNIKSGTYTTTADSETSGYALNIKSDSNTVVTVDGGEFYGSATGGVTGKSAVTVQKAKNKIIINGGKFVSGAKEGTAYSVENYSPDSVIKGGTFEGSLVNGYKNITGGTFTADPSAQVADGYVAVKNDDGKYEVVEFTNWSQVADTSWYKEGNSAFTITTAKQLAGLAKLVNEGNSFAGKTVTLGANIDLTGAAWDGIGIYSKRTAGNAFSGTFNGDGKTISNMIFAKANENEYRGLFNQLYRATVKNVTVECDGFAVDVSGSYGGAAIAGHSISSTIEGCVAEGAISGTHNVAGIVVRVQGSTIKNCINKASLTNSYSKLGGIVNLTQTTGNSGVPVDGEYLATLIEGCVNEGTITSTSRGENGVGGILGWNGYHEGAENVGASDATRVTIKDCENKGAIIGTGTAKIGQIAGSAEGYLGDGGANKGFATTFGSDNSGYFNFATVENGVATYVNKLEAGKTYLVTAPNPKPTIKLNAGESITFDATLSAFDESGITSDYEIEETTDGKKTTYSVAAPEPIITNSAAANPEHPHLNNSSVIWGQVDVTNGVGIKSLVIELYAGEENLATTTLNNVDNILNLGYTAIAWHTLIKGTVDPYWTTVWHSDPVANKVPTHIFTYVNGVNAGKTDVTFNWDGGVTVAKWATMPGVKVAKIGDTTYETLEAAIEAANAGDTIEVLADEIELPVIKKAGLIFKTEIGTKITNEIKNTNSDGGWRIDGTTFDGFEFTKRIGLIGKDLTIRNCKFTGYDGIYYGCASGTWTIEGCVFDNKVYALQIGEGNGIANVTNCTFTGGFNTYGVETNFKGCTFKKGTYGVVQTHSKMTLTDCEFAADWPTGEDGGHVGVANDKATDAVVEIYNTTYEGGTMFDLMEKRDQVGTFVVDPSKDENGKYTNGTFAIAPAADKLAEGFVPVENADGTFGVVEKAEEVKTLDTKVLVIRTVYPKINDKGAKYSVRLFGGIDTLEYKEIGFVMTPDGKEAAYVNTRDLYSKVNVKMSKDAGYTPLTPSDFNKEGTAYASQYIYTVSAGFGPDFASKNITFKPYAKLFDGTYIYGDEKTMSIVAE